MFFLFRRYIQADIDFSINQILRWARENSFDIIVLYSLKTFLKYDTIHCEVKVRCETNESITKMAGWKIRRDKQN